MSSIFDEDNRKRRKDHLETLLSTLNAQRKFVEATKAEKEQFRWDAAKEISDLARIDEEIRAIESELRQLAS